MAMVTQYIKHLLQGVLPIMAYAGRLRPKGVPFSGFRKIKEYGFHKLRYIRVGKSAI